MKLLNILILTFVISESLYGRLHEPQKDEVKEIDALKGQTFTPLVIIHGIRESPKNLKTLTERVATTFPGIELFVLDHFNGINSFKAMKKQHDVFKADLVKIMKNYPEGINLLGYSQGGLLARCILQSTDHNVKTFIALSSPNGGQFGATKNIQEWFPHISDRRALHKFLYSAAGQKISFGNYWKDPFQLDEYSKKSDYLAIFNGESDRVKPEENWRVNFGKLETLVTIGGDSDEIITPWQSAHFANYAKNDDETVWNATRFDYFSSNIFGLKDLENSGRWIRHNRSGIKHSQWIRDAQVAHELIFPHLL